MIEKGDFDLAAKQAEDFHGPTGETHPERPGAVTPTSRTPCDELPFRAARSPRRAKQTPRRLTSTRRAKSPSEVHRDHPEEAPAFTGLDRAPSTATCPPTSRRTSTHPMILVAIVQCIDQQSKTQRIRGLGEKAVELCNRRLLSRSDPIRSRSRPRQPNSWLSSKPPHKITWPPISGSMKDRRRQSGPRRKVSRARLNAAIVALNIIDDRSQTSMAVRSGLSNDLTPR